MTTDTLPLDDALHVYQTMAGYHRRTAAVGVSWYALLAVAAIAQGLEGHTWRGAIERQLAVAEAGEWTVGWSYARSPTRMGPGAAAWRRRPGVR